MGVKAAKAKGEAGIGVAETGLRPAPQADVHVMALDLPPGDLSGAMQAYFAKCEEKLGFVPNVLRAYAHDNAKLEAFAAFHDELMRRRPGCRSSGAR